MADPGAKRVTVGTFGCYEDAQRGLRSLVSQRLPLERTGIIARQFQPVEQVAGRLDSWAATGLGAVSGAAAGALLGLSLAFFDLAGTTGAGSWLVVWAMLIGAAVGALVGQAGRVLVERRREVFTTLYFQAGRFDLVADATVAEQATRLLRATRPAA